ncbi:MAG: ABC transporter substrate-binding protein [Spirochaetaceae bacterium]|nr:ABC transporter substrate-binding protein [Spirochaetaceae bacterium]
MHLKRIMGICMLLMGSFSLFAGGAKEKGSLVLAVCAPLTGDSAMYGETVRDGVVFAVDAINAAGGIQGKQIELLIMDDKGDPKEAALVAQRVSENSNVFAVIGHVNSSCTLAALPIYAEAGLTVLNTSSSAERITQLGYRNFFRTVIHDGLQAPMMVRHAVTNRGRSRIACIAANSDYGFGLLSTAKATASAMGVQIVAEEMYVPLVDKDFSVQIAKIKTANPDALLILGDYNEAGLIIRQMRTAGMTNIDIITPAACSNQAMIDLAGAQAAEGVFLLGYWDPDRPEPLVRDFVNAYRQKTGNIPDERNAYGYEIPYIIKLAIEQGAARETLPEYLRRIEFTGPTGYTKFDGSGDVSEKMQMVFIVKNGQFTSWVK